MKFLFLMHLSINLVLILINKSLKGEIFYYQCLLLHILDYYNYFNQYLHLALLDNNY